MHSLWTRFYNVIRLQLDKKSIYSSVRHKLTTVSHPNREKFANRKKEKKKKKKKIDLRFVLIPICGYTIPQFANIGLSLLPIQVYTHVVWRHYRATVNARWIFVVYKFSLYISMYLEYTPTRSSPSFPSLFLYKAREKSNFNCISIAWGEFVRANASLPKVSHNSGRDPRPLFRSRAFVNVSFGELSEGKRTRYKIQGIARPW